MLLYIEKRVNLMIKKIFMKNLICSNCAGKIEKAISELPYIESASFNFPNQIMLIDVTDEYDEDSAIIEIKKIVDSIEDGVETYAYDKRHLVETKKSIDKYNSFFIGMIIYFLGFIALYIYKGNEAFGMLFEHIIEDFTMPLAFVPVFWVGYFFFAYKIFLKTLKGVRRKEFFNENTLMFIATIAAMSLGYFFEAILVIVFYTLGEFLQHKAVHRSKQEVSSLMDLKIDYANKVVNGKVVIVDPLSIKKGDVLVVKNGEKIPVDGRVIKGSTSLNTSALTGEAKLTTVSLGDYILSGNLNVGSVIEIEASKEYAESTIARVIDLIENSTNHKAKTENFITKFARYYTPFVTVAAFLMFLIPTLLDPNPAHTSDYIYRAATFLVISCPCALVLSIPLSYFSGIGAAARKGILFKGSTFLHSITNVDTIGIDKTGTLTHGNFTVGEFTDLETLKIAASADRFSSHPIAISIVKFYEGEYYDYENIEEVPGMGLVITTPDGKILVGNRKLLGKHNVKVKDKKTMIGSNVFVSKNGKYIGKIVVKDEIKKSSMNVMRRLSKKYNITILTGDNEFIAKDVAGLLGGINYESGLLPEEKIEKFNQLQTKNPKLYVGDGINDAPLLRNADIGVAMGGGSEIALDVADVIIMNDDLALLEDALNIAKKTKRIVFQNITFSLGVKFSFLILAGFGYSTMLMAIFADVGITLLAVMNSLRIIYSRGNK
jgi:Cd2+/Zn2+-exporting ATPase